MMEKPISIIVVDDNPDIRTLLSEFLSQHHFQVSTVENGNNLHTLLQQNQQFDLIVLDIMLPDIDGITLCQQIRMKSNIPVIMLTAVNSDSDRIISLEFGADDYLAKPFNPRELLARIKAVLRRTKDSNFNEVDKNSPHQDMPVYNFSGWRLDVATRRLMSPDQAEVALSAASYDLLMAFLENPQRVMTRDQLLTITKNRISEPYDRSIDIQISRLRQKIEEDPKNPKIFKTVQNVGYIFTSTVAKSY